MMNFVLKMMNFASKMTNQVVLTHILVNHSLHTLILNTELISLNTELII